MTVDELLEKYIMPEFSQLSHDDLKILGVGVLGPAAWGIYSKYPEVKEFFGMDFNGDPYGIKPEKVTDDGWTYAANLASTLVWNWLDTDPVTIGDLQLEPVQKPVEDLVAHVKRIREENSTPGWKGPSA